ncbi:response regulator [Massilia sp. H-1]|nr:response regulator [Massilia sp. H-1]
MPSALAAVHNGAPPDIVLLDIVLPGQPGKDGFDVLTFIRRQLAWSRVPVVMVTSEVSDDQVMKGLKAWLAPTVTCSSRSSGNRCTA